MTTAEWSELRWTRGLGDDDLAASEDARVERMGAWAKEHLRCRHARKKQT